MIHLTRRAAGRRAVAAALAGATFPACSRRAAAAPLPQPSERTILTISGRIANANKGDAAQFDRPMLEALGMSGFETTTPWYPGPVRFDGVTPAYDPPPRLHEHTDEVLTAETGDD